MMSNKEVEVSVCIAAYNHESYIAQCLESVINQKTNFKFEIIVGEDCSTDNTKSIIETYARAYPSLIKAIYHAENNGAVENIKSIYKTARGKYIAHIDGDDAAKQGKLQMQYDILQANPDCSVCSHNMIYITADNKETSSKQKNLSGKYNIYDFLKSPPLFDHSSKMFINNYSDIFWDTVLKDDNILDMDIHFENLKRGDLYHIDKNLGYYRVGVGISTNQSRYNDNLALGAERIYKNGLLFFKNDKSKVDKIKDFYASSMLKCAYNYAIYNKDKDKFNEYVNKSLEIKKLNANQIIFKLATYFPNFSFKLLKIRSELLAKLR